MVRSASVDHGYCATPVKNFEKNPLKRQAITVNNHVNICCVLSLFCLWEVDERDLFKGENATSRVDTLDQEEIASHEMRPCTAERVPPVSLGRGLMSRI